MCGWWCSKRVPEFSLLLVIAQHQTQMRSDISTQITHSEQKRIECTSCMHEPVFERNIESKCDWLITVDCWLIIVKSVFVFDNQTERTVCISNQMEFLIGAQLRLCFTAGAHCWTYQIASQPGMQLWIWRPKTTLHKGCSLFQFSLCFQFTTERVLDMR